MRFVNKSKSVLNFQGRLIDPESKIFISEESVIKYQSLIYKYYGEGKAIIEDFDGKELSIKDIRDIIAKRSVAPLGNQSAKPEYLEIVEQENSEQETSEVTEAEANTNNNTDEDTEAKTDDNNDKENSDKESQIKAEENEETSETESNNNGNEDNNNEEVTEVKSDKAAGEEESKEAEVKEVKKRAPQRKRNTKK